MESKESNDRQLALEQAYRAMGFTHFYQVKEVPSFRFAVARPTRKRRYWTIATMGLSLTETIEQDGGITPHPECWMRLQAPLVEPMDKADGLITEKDAQHWLFLFLWRAVFLSSQTLEKKRTRAIFPIHVALQLKADFSFAFWEENQRAQRALAQLGEKVPVWQIIVLRKREAELAQRVGLTTVLQYFVGKNPRIFSERRLSRVSETTIRLVRARRLIRPWEKRGKTGLLVSSAWALWDWARRHHGFRKDWLVENASAVMQEDFLPKSGSWRAQALPYHGLQTWCAAFFHFLLHTCCSDARTYWEADWAHLRQAFACARRRTGGDWVVWQDGLRDAIDVRMRFRLARWCARYQAWRLRHRGLVSWQDASSNAYACVSPETRLPLQEIHLGYRAPRDPMLADADSGWRFFTAQEECVRWQKLASDRRLLLVPLASLTHRIARLADTPRRTQGSWWVCNRRGKWHCLLDAHTYTQCTQKDKTSPTTEEKEFWWDVARETPYV